MIRYLLALLALAVTSSQSQQGHVRIIDFFGTEGMDVEKARSVLPIHQGDEIRADQSPEIEKEIRRALKNALGQEPTDVGIYWGLRPVVILIGLGGANSHFPTIAAPTGKTCLSDEAMRISHDAWEAFEQARLLGEDDSRGYALSNDAAARSRNKWSCVDMQFITNEA